MALGERLSGRKVIASELFSRLWILSVPAISCGVPAGLRNWKKGTLRGGCAER
jgi:hypothetical protein